MNKDKVIVGLGEVLWDSLPEGMVLGGAPANCAFHASQYGCCGVVASAVGRDFLGDRVLSELESKDVEHVIARNDMPTGVVEVSLDMSGSPQYDIKENAAWDAIPYSGPMRQLAMRCDAVCFGTLAQRSVQSRSTIYNFLDAMPATSMRVFDANLRQRFYSEPIITESLRRSNVLKINEAELGVFCDMYGVGECDLNCSCLSLIDKFALDAVILTCGSEGSYVITKNESSYLPTPCVTVADTVGAGDSFTAAFISAMLGGRSLRDAHHIAVEVSAYVCTQHGATPLWNDSLRSM